MFQHNMRLDHETNNSFLWYFWLQNWTVKYFWNRGKNPAAGPANGVSKETSYYRNSDWKCALSLLAGVFETIIAGRWCWLFCAMIIFITNCSNVQWPTITIKKQHCCHDLKKSRHVCKDIPLPSRHVHQLHVVNSGWSKTLRGF